MNLNNLSRRADSMFHFDPIQIGPFKVSVQAGEGMYSEPQAWRATGESYTAFEVAIFEGDEWITPREDERFQGFPWASLFEAGGETSVAGYVPRAEVEQIIADLRGMLH
jgi:hypothetical protein